VGSTHAIVLFARALFELLGVALCVLVVYAMLEGRNVRLRDETALGVLIGCAVVAAVRASRQGRRRRELLEWLMAPPGGPLPPVLG
jgi:peptidoglycan/LPS O-acetylase OafA/YrhL